MQRPDHLLGDEFAPLFSWLCREYDIVSYINNNGVIHAKSAVRGTKLTKFKYLRINVALDNLSYMVEDINESEFIKAFPNINTSDRFKKDLQEISSLIENVISEK